MLENSVFTSKTLVNRGRLASKVKSAVCSSVTLAPAHHSHPAHWHQHHFIAPGLSGKEDQM